MNFLCLGDPHFKVSNIKDVETLIENVVKKTKELKPDFFVIMGDTLHTNEVNYHAPWEKITELLEELHQLTRVYLLIGNHDYTNASQYLTDKHFFVPFKKWKNVYVVDSVIVHSFSPKKREFSEKFEEGAFNLCFLPYVQNGRFLEALNESGEPWEECNVIFAHQEFKGCQMQSKMSDEGDEWDEEYPFVISGHIHSHQLVGDNIFYTGSAMQHGPKDTGDKSLWQFIFKEDLSYESVPHSLGIRKKRLVKLDYEDFKNFDFSKFKDVCLQIDVKGHSDQLKSLRTSRLYKDLVAKGVKISTTSISSTITKEIEEFKKGKDNKSYIEILKELCGEELKEALEEVLSFQ